MFYSSRLRQRMTMKRKLSTYWSMKSYPKRRLAAYLCAQPFVAVVVLLNWPWELRRSTSTPHDVHTPHGSRIAFLSHQINILSRDLGFTWAPTSSEKCDAVNDKSAKNCAMCISLSVFVRLLFALRNPAIKSPHVFSPRLYSGGFRWRCSFSENSFSIYYLWRDGHPQVRTHVAHLCGSTYSAPEGVIVAMKKYRYSFRGCELRIQSIYFSV